MPNSCDTVKLEERTCVKENDGTGTVQSIKMLPVTPTSKVLSETNNVNYTLRGKILKNGLFFKNRIEGNI